MATTQHTTAKRSAITADIFGTTLTLTFSNGAEIVLDSAKLSPEMQQQAMLHGLKQKLVDAAAIARNVDTGRSATVEDKYNAVRKVYARLTSDTPAWNEGRGAAGESVTAGGGAILVRALIKMTGKDEAYVKDFLSAKTKEQRAALRKNPQVLAVIAELQAATVTNGINTAELLGELGMADDEQEPAAVTPDEPNDAQPSDEPATPAAKKPNTRTSKKRLATANAE
jgi:hypothetical protein